MVGTLHQQKRCSCLLVESFAAEERSGCQTRLWAWCPGWETNDHTNLAPAGGGIPWFESGLRSQVFLQLKRGLLVQKISKHGHPSLIVSVPMPPVRSVRCGRLETQRGLPAMPSCRNQPLAASMAHPVGADRSQPSVHRQDAREQHHQ